MANINRKVIGYFALASPTEVVCTGDRGDACVISGPVRAMKAFLKKIDPYEQRKHTVKRQDLGKYCKALNLVRHMGLMRNPIKNFIRLHEKKDYLLKKALLMK